MESLGSSMRADHFKTVLIIGISAFSLFALLGAAKGPMKDCPSPKNWQKVESLGVNWLPQKNSEQKIELWRKRLIPKMADRKNERVLVFSINDICADALTGSYRSGKYQTPFGDAKIEKISISSSQELIKVTSAYYHGFTFQVTSLFSLVNRRLVEVWQGFTYEAGPEREKRAQIIFEDVNGDGIKDLRYLYGAPETWLWSRKEKKFVKK